MDRPKILVIDDDRLARDIMADNWLVRRRISLATKPLGHTSGARNTACLPLKE